MLDNLRVASPTITPVWEETPTTTSAGSSELDAPYSSLGATWTLANWTLWRAVPTPWRRTQNMFGALSDLSVDTSFDAGVLVTRSPRSALRFVIQDSYPYTAPTRFDVSTVSDLPTYAKKHRITFGDLGPVQLAALEKHFASARPLEGERLQRRREELRRAAEFFRSD